MTRVTITRFSEALLVSALCLAAPSWADDRADFLALMNRGKAHLENRSSAEAIDAFKRAVGIDPRSAAAWRNLARAHLMSSHPRARASVLEALDRAGALEDDSAATNYLAGLTLLRMSRFDEAAERLRRAVQLDPDSATLRFQLANALQATNRHDEAVVQLRETIRLDPLHASARYKLAGHARQAGDRQAYQTHLREFMRLRKLLGPPASRDALERCVHLLPEAARSTGPVVPPPIAVRFTDVTDTLFADATDRTATAAAVIEVDEKGRCVFFVCDAEGAAGLLAMTRSGAIQRTRIDLKLPDSSPFMQCIVGNFHDDVPAGAVYDAALHAKNDLFLIGPDRAVLLKRRGPLDFADATESAGLGGLTGRRAGWIDSEHDGDLDLLIARASGLELWQNKGNGTFRNATGEVGLGKTGPTRDVAVADFDANVAIDLVAAGDDQSTRVFENLRTGRFAATTEPPGPWPAARRVLADDLDNNGYPDLVSIDDKTATIVYSRRARRQTLDLAGLDAVTALLIDFDNDGWLDLCVAGSERAAPETGSIRLWRNGGRAWEHVSETTRLTGTRIPPVRHAVAADIDGDGDSDLLLLTSDRRMRLLRNDGGHVNGQLKIRLVGLKTNPQGIGTHIELRHGADWITRSVSAIPIEVGLGGRTRLDTVQTVWTGGVVDNRFDVEVSKKTVLTITEKNVATGSCPFLYAWDGSAYRFVTDVLGNAPVGLPLARDRLLVADPDEFVIIGDGDGFRPLDGAYRLNVTSEFLEVLYLDYARLVAVDHAPLIELHPTDKLMAPPFPASELWALTDAIRPIRAVGDDGIDRTRELADIDGVFAPPGPLLPPPLRGMCHPMSITLDFGPVPADRPLVLALTGWLQYGQASTNIAVSQNPSLKIIPPMLEVGNARGEWRPVDVTVGMPAGKTKTILCDLEGRLPRDAMRLRLTTTFEIRWDRIGLFERVSSDRARIHELEVDRADLAWRGFSEIRSRAENHPTTPDYDRVSDRPPWRNVLEGWCTRYGDVRDLVTAIDGRFVICNAGDEVAMQFDAPRLPPVPAGQVRTFFMYCFGWEKDGDHNVVEGHTVEPLPGRRDPDDRTAGGRSADWRLDYNTRWVSRDRFVPPRPESGDRLMK